MRYFCVALRSGRVGEVKIAILSDFFGFLSRTRDDDLTISRPLPAALPETKERTNHLLGYRT